jgi:hypothetical protein
MKNKIPMPSNRKFGLFFSFIFFLISAYFFYSNNDLQSLIFLIFFLFFLFTSIIHPKLLYPFNKLWNYLGYFLGRIFSPVVLGVIYFLIITPYALVFKIISRDELQLKNFNAKTYWITSNDSKRIDINYFRKQY